MQTLAELAHYSRWANAKVFARCTEVEKDVLDATAGGTVDSIVATLKHMVGTQDAFLAFMTGRDPLHGHSSPAAFLAEYMGHDLIWFGSAAAEIDDDFVALIGRGDAVFLAGEFRLPWFDFPLTRHQGLTQVLTHSQTHRVQVFSALGARGFAVPGIDFVHMLYEERGTPGTFGAR